MSEQWTEALKAVYVNIDRLRLESFHLYRQRKFALSAHLAIICGEECAKYLLAHCREFLDAEVFRKRFSHIPKYRVLSAPWFVAGMLEMTYLMFVGSREGFFGPLEKHALVLEDLLLHAGQNNPARLAEVISECLQPDADHQKEARRKAEFESRENHRKLSVYVDLGDSGEILGSPIQIDGLTARKYLKDIRVAIAVIDFVISEVPDIFKFIDSLPRDMRDEAKRSAAKMVAHVRGKTETS